MSGHMRPSQLKELTIHTQINEMFCLPMFQYHQINVIQIIDSLDPGLVVESIQMSTLVCGVNVKTMIHRHHLFHAPCIYIILVTVVIIRHYTGDTLFTLCNMMHPTIAV